MHSPFLAQNPTKTLGFLLPYISPRTRSYKKDDKPLLNLTGAYEPLHKREGAYVYPKEGTRVPSLNTGS
jgi:hypothetical protein